MILKCMHFRDAGTRSCRMQFQVGTLFRHSLVFYSLVKIVYLVFLIYFQNGKWNKNFICIEEEIIKNFNNLLIYKTENETKWAPRLSRFTVAWFHIQKTLFFLFNLLGWHWLTKLYRFQVHSSTTNNLYTVLCVHRPKSSLLQPHSYSLYPPPPPLIYKDPTCNRQGALFVSHSLKMCLWISGMS